MGNRLVPVLASSRLFGGLDHAVLEELAEAVVVKRLVRGELLWRTGDVASSFSSIRAGIVKIVRRTDGDDIIVSLFGPHETVGDVAAVERGVFPADAVAASPEVEVLRVPAELLLSRIKRDPKVAEAISRALLDHTRALQEKISVMSAGSVHRRLGTVLLGLLDRFGDQLDDNTWALPVAVSRAELAALIGARVETTIRAIRSWEKRGLLETLPDGFRFPSRKALVTEVQKAK